VNCSHPVAALNALIGTDATTSPSITNRRPGFLIKRDADYLSSNIFLVSTWVPAVSRQK
jgi:hypothetical protein